MIALAVLGALPATLVGAAPAAKPAGEAPLPQGLEKLAEAPDAVVYRDPAVPAYVRLPPGYRWVETKAGLGVHYGYAFRHETDGFELRFHFSPLTNARAFKGAPKPGQTRADLDAPSPAYAKTVQFNMGAAEEANFLPFPAGGVRAEFAADWGYTSSPLELDPKHPFAGGYRFAQVHLLHRNGAGSYVLMLLAADADTLIRRIQEDPLLYSIRFVDPKDRPDPRAAVSCPAGTELKGKPFPVGRVLVCMRSGTETAHGPFVELHASGVPRLRGAYKDGKPDGTIERFDHLGNLVNRAAYRGGKPHGSNTDFYPGGGKAAESLWEAGERAGPVRFFDEKGKPTDEAGMSAVMERISRERQLRDLQQALEDERRR